MRSLDTNSRYYTASTGTWAPLADEFGQGHPQRPGNPTQGIQTRIYAGIVFEPPYRMCGHAHLAREIFLANSRLGTEPADLIAFGGTLSVCAHEGISKQLPTVSRLATETAVMSITTRCDRAHSM